MITIPLKDLQEIQEVGREILPGRIPYIVNDQLNGKHWYFAILEEAAEIVAMRRQLECVA